MEREKAFATFFDAMPVGLILVDRQTRIRKINSLARNALGISRAAVTGRPINTCLKNADECVRLCLNSKSTLRGMRLKCEKSEVIAHFAPMPPADPAAGVIVCIEGAEALVDMARKLGSYWMLNKQFEAIFKSSSDGLWLLDGEGQVLNVNPAAQEIAGIAPEEVIGRHIQGLLRDKIFDKGVTPKVLATGRQVNMVQFVKKTGRQVLATGTPVFDDDGQIRLVVVNERDMTQLNDLMEKVEKAHQILSKNREKLAELSMIELERHKIIAESAAMREVLQTSIKLAHLGATNILIQGESGTGKGLLAKFIHKNIGGPNRPFIAINCAALPENLLEAELFGYEKGAFTGADVRGKAGLVELARGGTLFLDEIGELPYPVQAKLLQCIEDYEILRIGGLRPIKVDCVILAATNRDLEVLVEQGRFRRDLFYRLNSFPIHIPPLRRRPEDIVEMSHRYLAKFNHDYGTDKRISPQGMNLLQAYPFPGNCRELRNLIREAVVMSDADYLCDYLRRSLEGRSVPAATRLDLNHTRPFNLKAKLQETERRILEEIYRHFGSTRETARHLGISQPSVVRKLHLYGLVPQHDQKIDHLKPAAGNPIGGDPGPATGAPDPLV